MDAAKLSDAAFWLDFAPDMSIGVAASNCVTTPAQSLERLTSRMSKDGYFNESDSALFEAAPRIADTVRRCVEAGLPAVFVWLYDEPWQCFARLRPVIAHFLGDDYKMLAGLLGLAC